MTVLSCFLNIVLMIFLSHVELLCQFNLCDDRLRKIFGLLFDEFSGNFKLFLIHAPYATSILWAEIRTLAILLSWVMHLKETLQKLSKGDFLWIICDFDCLSMASISVTNFFISRVQDMPLLIATLSCYNSRSNLESMLYSPETASSKVGNLIFSSTLAFRISFYHRCF